MSNKNPEFKMKKIIDGTFKSIIDTSIDYSEIGVDSLINGELVKEVPIVKTIYCLAKTGINIHNRIFAEKLLRFIKAVNSGEASIKEKEMFKNKMQDENYREKVGELIFSLLDNFNEFEKSNILGKLYLKHVNGKYDYNTFVELAICLENIIMSDYKFLKFLYENKDKKYYLLSNLSLEGISRLVLVNCVNRLQKSNLIYIKKQVLWEELQNPSGDMSEDGYFQLGSDMALKISEFGILFYDSVN